MNKCICRYYAVSSKAVLGCNVINFSTEKRLCESLIWHEKRKWIDLIKPLSQETGWMEKVNVYLKSSFRGLKRRKTHSNIELVQGF